MSLCSQYLCICEVQQHEEPANPLPAILYNIIIDQPVYEKKSSDEVRGQKGPGQKVSQLLEGRKKVIPVTKTSNSHKVSLKRTHKAYKIK